MNQYFYRLRFKNTSKKISVLISLSLIILISLSFYLNSDNDHTMNYDHISNNDSEKHPKISATWYLYLTNTQINNTRHYHNTTITIEGKLQYINSTGIPGYNVRIFVDDIEDPSYTNTTNADGEFQIYYTIPFTLDIYAPQGHKIHVDVIESTPALVRKQNHFILYTNATSFFDIPNKPPAIPGEIYNIPGYLRYDNINGNGIPNQQINSNWINGSNPLPPNLPVFTDINGFLQSNLPVPPDNYSNVFYLNLSYSGDSYYVNATKTKIQITLFRNITCVWTTVTTASEGQQITISGKIFDSNNTNIEINNRLVNIYYDNQPEGTTTTDENGDFQFIFNIPSGLGNKPIYVEIVSSLLNIRSNATYISITVAIPSETSSPSGKSGTKDPPFFNFFLVFIPIVIGGIVAFAIYAYFYLRKQEEESRLVKVPLEGRIRNLKILKDTGRLEESLSYLFQSIYLELINAKYGRIKRPTETIRDFAIISVKDLNLNPANIYPFIQNIERIIYDKPFIIEEKDFYSAVELFSPIYFELTGYQFVLKF